MLVERPNKTISLGEETVEAAEAHRDCKFLGALPRATPFDEAPAQDVALLIGQRHLDQIIHGHVRNHLPPRPSEPSSSGRIAGATSGYLVECVRAEWGYTDRPIEATGPEYSQRSTATWLKWPLRVRERQGHPPWG